MKRTSRTLLITAAMSGLIAGTTPSSRAETTNAAPGQLAPSKKAPSEHSCSGQNDCKGIGGCKTDSHGCKFLNDCKGKGGCEVTKKDIENWEKQQKASSGSGTTNAPAGK